MSELRQMMIGALHLKGLSERTQECSVRAVRQLAEHFRQSPNLISRVQIRLSTILAEKFIRRFLQHVHPGHRRRFQRDREGIETPFADNPAIGLAIILHIWEKGRRPSADLNSKSHSLRLSSTRIVQRLPRGERLALRTPRHTNSQYVRPRLLDSSLFVCCTPMAYRDDIYFLLVVIDRINYSILANPDSP